MQSAYLQRLAAAKQEYARVGEQFGEQLSIDLMQIALHRQGWGYERIKRLIDDMNGLSKYYDAAFHKNPEQEVWQARMDAEILDIIKGQTRFYTFEERYPAINTIGVGWKQKGVDAIEWHR